MKGLVKAKELFADWEDFDVASYYLACLLGIMEYDSTFDVFRSAKGVFQTNNPVGNALTSMLELMVEAGMLEQNSESQFRWNPEFKGYWENGSAGRS